MQPYQKNSRDSGVTAFEIGHDFIIVRFTKNDAGEAWDYTYSYRRPGRTPVEEMMRRAVAGEGLATYIAQEVKDKFATKRKVSPRDASSSRAR